MVVGVVWERGGMRGTGDLAHQVEFVLVVVGNMAEVLGFDFGREVA